MLEQIRNINIEKNLDKIIFLFQLNWILKITKDFLWENLINFESINHARAIWKIKIRFFFLSTTNRELNDIVNELFRYSHEQMNRFSLIVEAREWIIMGIYSENILTCSSKTINDEATGNWCFTISRHGRTKNKIMYVI